jgi:hypothetical protein
MVALLPFCGPLFANRKFVWFWTLKNSARNSRLVRSVVRNFLKPDKSQVVVYAEKGPQGET